VLNELFLCDLLENSSFQLSQPPLHPFIIDIQAIEVKKQLLLGKGGFGEVYEGSYRNEPKAIKISSVPIDQLSSLMQECIV